MPMVLLHGFCEHSILWKKTLPYLLKNHPIITYDLPGFGSNTTNTFDSIRQVANKINQDITQLIKEKYLIVGHSLGGYIAAEMIHQEPQTKIGISMVHSSFQSDSEQKKNNRKKLIHFLQDKSNEPFLNEFKKNLVSPENYDFLKKEIEEMIFPQSNIAIIQASKAMMNRADLTSILAKIDVPVQYIIGIKDTFWNVKNLIQEASICKISQINVIQNCGHLAMWEQPNEFNHQLESFATLCQEISHI